jgi:type II secretory pathway component PulL
MHTTQSTLRRLRDAVALLALALTFAISPTAAQQWTPQQRAACEPDAMRLCNQYLPDVQRTSACMSHYRRYLSPACRAVFSGGQRKKMRRRHG